MKVVVTHLKAPWPQGTRPGAVVSFAGLVPAWATGKCRPATDLEASAHAALAAEAEAKAAEAASLAAAEEQAAAERAAIESKAAKGKAAKG